MATTASFIDPHLLFAWQAAHSIARGSPPPVPDRGGIRVDTGSEKEARRWVFPRMCGGLREIAQAITAPRHVLKLCGTDDELQGALPARWEMQPTNHFMIATAMRPETKPLPDGYRLDVIAPGPSREPASSRPTAPSPPAEPRRKRPMPSSTTASKPRPIIDGKAWGSR